MTAKIPSPQEGKTPLQLARDSEIKALLRAGAGLSDCWRFFAQEAGVDVFNSAEYAQALAEELESDSERMLYWNYQAGAGGQGLDYIHFAAGRIFAFT